MAITLHVASLQRYSTTSLPTQAGRQGHNDQANTQLMRQVVACLRGSRGCDSSRLIY
ncbi:MAG: hypothetical protein MK102_19420 [Fuerstiella sp.]|nr:hypothetical protein [Fuerstiella sp.]